MRNDAWTLLGPDEVWDERTIQTFVTNKVQESIHLDYKSSGALQKTDAKTHDISKDVSSFANSDGGTIIYGVSEKGHVPTAIDDGVDPTYITREWLEQIINSHITARVEGLRIHPVPLSGDKAGRTAYVVEISKAMARAGHQADDKRYYKRFNFQSIPMEDYEVKDLINRTAAPDLSLKLAFDTGVEAHVSRADASDYYGQIGLMVSLINESVQPAPYAIVQLHIDGRLRVNPLVNYGTPNPHQVITKDEVSTGLTTFRYNFGQRERIPVFRGAPFQLFDGPIDVQIPWPDRPTSELRFDLSWDVAAPHMSTRKGRGAMVVSATTRVWLERFDSP
jgi:Putative DNA-binding domain